MSKRKKLSIGDRFDILFSGTLPKKSKPKPKRKPKRAKRKAH
jgi:hypothetical protein